jgi:hypothetical protein
VTEVATGGTTSGFTLNALPEGIATGPDGNLWVTETYDPGGVARVTPSGAVTEFTGGSTPGFTANGDPTGIAAGPDGNLWFTEQTTPGRIGRVTPSGNVTEFTGGLTPGFAAGAHPFFIAPGPDGSLWFTEPTLPARIGHITPNGKVTEFVAGTTPGLTSDGAPTGITTGPDGNMWFTQQHNPGRVARITTPPIATTTIATATGSNSATVAGTVNGHAQATSSHVEYGPLGGSTTTTPEQALGTTSGDAAVSFGLTGLLPTTAYQARVVATNPTDTTPGAFLTFTTPAASPPRKDKISKFKMTPATFVAATHGPPLIAARRSKALKPGAIVSYRGTQPATTTFTVQRPVRGRLQGHSCVKPGKRNRKRKRCTRYVAIGSFTHPDIAGANRFRWTGRIGGRKLKPGRYRLQAIPHNGAGAGAPVFRRFRVKNA